MSRREYQRLRRLNSSSELLLESLSMEFLTNASINCSLLQSRPYYKFVIIYIFVNEYKNIDESVITILHFFLNFI